MTTIRPHLGLAFQAASPRRQDASLQTERGSRTRRLILLLVGTWLLSVFDLAFTLAAKSMGVLIELNPLAGWLFENHGDWAVVLFKVALMATGTAILIVYRRRKCAESAAWFLIVVHALLSVHWYAYYHGDDASEAVIEISTVIAVIESNAPVTPVVPALPAQTQTVDWQSVIVGALPH